MVKSSDQLASHSSAIAFSWLLLKAPPPGYMSVGTFPQLPFELPYFHKYTGLGAHTDNSDRLPRARFMLLFGVGETR